MLGTAKQMVGSAVTTAGLDGSEWTKDGHAQKAKGESEIKAAQ
jgi:hypothetical protein